jgi:hypothetical protein
MIEGLRRWDVVRVRTRLTPQQVIFSRRAPL